MRHVNILIITGNPFALQGPEAYSVLEENLTSALSAALINDENMDERSYLRKLPAKKTYSKFPYPNPIKLMSREK